MREYATPPLHLRPRAGSLTDDVVDNARARPGSVALSRRTHDGWSDVTAADFCQQVRATAAGLLASGLPRGARVGLISRTRYEWTLLDYALWWVGAVSVPVYDTSAPDQALWILESSGAQAAVVETEAQAQLARSAGLRVWTIESGGITDLVALGAEVDAADLERRRASVGPDDIATVVYTSGTTGPPRGCVLTHGAFMAEIDATTHELSDLFDAPEASTLLVLPLPHIFARIVQVGAVRLGVRLGHAPDVRHISDDVQSFRPTFLLAVPRVFERVFNAASQQAAAEGRGRTFDRATDLAIAWSRAQDTGRTGPSLRARRALYDRLVYSRVRESLGGACSYAISGGAPIGERLAHYFRGIGVPVLEGYGLTETTGAVTVNLPEAQRVGTAGRPVPGTAIRVSEEGELQVRTQHLFSGYWNDPASSQAAIAPDGWLRTGDLGEIDAEGFVRVTGRAREVLVTSGGKHVAPSALEDRLRAHPLVDQCLVVGDGRPYVAALVTLDLDALAEWVDRSGVHGDLDVLCRHPELLAEIQRGVDVANGTVSQAESIRAFRVLPTTWSEETGELTPSLKLRRNTLLRELRSEVARLYDD